MVAGLSAKMQRDEIKLLNNTESHPDKVDGSYLL